MAATEKVDLFKLHRKEYASPKKPILMNVKTAVYFAIDGRGAPGDYEELKMKKQHYRNIMNLLFLNDARLSTYH